MSGLNVIVANGNEQDNDRNFFSPNDKIALIPTQADMFDILVIAGIWPSKNQARKNWSGEKSIPVGWTDITLGKKNRTRICIWNPAPHPSTGLIGCLNKDNNG